MSGQFINHFGAVRLRVTGAGNLKSTLISLDDVFEQSLAQLVMSSTANKFPTLLSNFMQMKAQLKLEVTDINESFEIKEIHIYIKPTYTSFPQ
jgi:hypothetical protein